MDELATRHAAEPVPPEDGRADGPATADGAPEPWGALGPLAEPARRAARALAAATSAVKDAALRGWADALEARVPEIVEANTVDMDRARAGGVSAAILDRLLIDEPRTGQMADGLRQVAALKDPVGIVLDGWTLPNGLRVEKVRVPLGVVGVIYEGRPNVTVDAAGLGVKAGNAVLLRGSRVAERSNAVLVRILQDASEAAGLPAAAVQSVPPTRESARDMMRARGLIDLLIPRGGADLIETALRIPPWEPLYRLSADELVRMKLNTVDVLFDRDRPGTAPAVS